MSDKLLDYLKPFIRKSDDDIAEPDVFLRLVANRIHDALRNDGSFHMSIETSGSTFEPNANEEVARILGRIADHLDTEQEIPAGLPVDCHDRKGRIVGSWSMTPPGERFPPRPERVIYLDI